jgi:hypothetical protein
MSSGHSSSFDGSSRGSDDFAQSSAVPSSLSQFLGADPESVVDGTPEKNSIRKTGIPKALSSVPMALSFIRPLSHSGADALFQSVQEMERNHSPKGRILTRLSAILCSIPLLPASVDSGIIQASA